MCLDDRSEVKKRWSVGRDHPVDTVVRVSTKVNTRVGHDHGEPPKEVGGPPGEAR